MVWSCSVLVFSCPASRFYTLAPRYWASRAENVCGHLRPPGPSCSQWGGEVASQKPCTFPQTQRDPRPEAAQPGSSTLAPSAPAPTSVQSRRALPDVFGADLPKAMPYWFCTNHVHLRECCCACVGFLVWFCFPIKANRAKKKKSSVR